MRVLLLIASALVASSALAQTPGSCETGTAQRFLNVSNVQASLFNTGGLFFGGSTTSGDGYLVPKVSGNSPIFAAGIWLSGTVNDDIRVTAARYGGYLFRPGPLNADGTLPNASDCSAYDRIYVVNVQEVSAYEAGQSPARDLAEWPVGLGAPTVDASGDPVAVTSREQVIDLAAGERPDLYGSQMAFWVMNDVGAPRGDGRTAPLGVEVQVTAFVMSGVEDLQGSGEASFYRFTVINRNPSTIENVRFSFFTDPDLGGAGDDYVGVDTTRSMALIYNSDNEDSAYGSPPPAAGFDMMSHQLAASSTWIGGGPDGTQDPGTAEQYYNYMQGLWGNGTPYYELNNGFEQPGAPTSSFFYAGDPVTESAWSEMNIDGAGTNSPYGDRRYVATVAFGALAPGDTATMDMAVLYGLGADHLDSITELRAVSDGVQAAYDAGTLFQRGGELATLSAPVLIGPDDGANVAQEDTVRFAWEPVEGAGAYELRWDSQPDGGFDRYVFATEPSVTLPVPRLASSVGTQPVYWKVVPIGPGAIGLPSEIWSVTVFQGGALELADGTPAYMEVVGPGGIDPCAEGARSRDGCDEVGGNLVYQSFNSTGEYYFGSAGGTATGSEPIIGQAAPNDFEIRFTEAGGLGYYTFQEGNIVPVPFEIWDIGPVTPGAANDPADDIRMIPVLFADNGGTCAFNADEIPEGEAAEDGYVESDRIYAYYPATSYADFELAFADSVSAAEGNCYIDADFTVDSFRAGARVIQRQVFGSSSDAPALPKTGTIIRMYTVDPLPVANEATPRAGDLSLGPAYPNPAASSLTIPYALTSAGEVELVVYDVLGRRVVELVNSRQPDGNHTAELDASALAPGIYVVRLRAGDETRATRITVVR